MYANSTYYPDFNDVQTIFEYLAGINVLKAATSKDITYALVPGDADCDGDVDLDDAEAILNSINDWTNNPLTDQGRINARASFMYDNNTYYPDMNDVQAVLEYLAGINILGCNTFKLPASSVTADFSKKTVYGDFNCDGKVDKKDVSALNDFIADTSDKTISAEQIRNADVFNPGSGLSAEDVQAISDCVRGEKVLPYSTAKYTKDKSKAGDAATHPAFCANDFI